MGVFVAGGGVDTVTRLQQVLACLSPPWLLRQVSAALLSDYDDYLVPGGLTSGPITLTEIVRLFIVFVLGSWGIDFKDNGFYVIELDFFLPV